MWKMDILLHNLLFNRKDVFLHDRSERWLNDILHRQTLPKNAKTSYETQWIRWTKNRLLNEVEDRDKMTREVILRQRDGST